MKKRKIDKGTFIHIYGYRDITRPGKKNIQRKEPFFDKIQRKEPQNLGFVKIRSELPNVGHQFSL